MIQRNIFEFLKKYTNLMIIFFILLSINSLSYSKSIRTNNGKIMYTKISEVKFQNYSEFARIRGEKVLAYNSNDQSTFINTIENKTFIQIIEEEMDMCFVRIPDIDLGYYEAWVNKNNIRKKKNNQIARYYSKPLVLIEDLIEKDIAWVYSDSTTVYTLPKANSTSKFILQFGSVIFIQNETKDYYDIKIFSENTQTYSSGWIKKADITRDERVLKGEMLDSRESSQSDIEEINDEQFKILEERKNKLLLIKQKQDNKALEDLSKSSDNNELQYYLSQLIESKKRVSHLTVQISDLNRSIKLYRDEISLNDRNIQLLNAEVLMAENSVKRITSNKINFAKEKRIKLQLEKSTREKIVAIDLEIKNLSSKKNSIINDIKLTDIVLDKNQNLVDSLYNSVINKNNIITQYRKVIRANSINNKKLSDLLRSLEEVRNDLKLNLDKQVKLEERKIDLVSKVEIQQKDLDINISKLDKAENNLSKFKIEKEQLVKKEYDEINKNLIAKLTKEKNKLTKVKSLVKETTAISLQLESELKQYFLRLSKSKENIVNTEEIIIKYKQNQIKDKEEKTKIIVDKKRFKQIRTYLEEIGKFNTALTKNEIQRSKNNNELLKEIKVVELLESQIKNKQLRLQEWNNELTNIRNSKEKSIINLKKLAQNRKRQQENLNSKILSLKEELLVIKKHSAKYKLILESNITEKEDLSKTLAGQKKTLSSLFKSKDLLHSKKLLSEQKYLDETLSLKNELETLKRDHNRVSTNISKLTIDLEDFTSLISSDSANLLKQMNNATKFSKKILQINKKYLEESVKAKESKDLLSSLNIELEQLLKVKKINTDSYLNYIKDNNSLADSIKAYDIVSIDKKSEIVLLKMQLKFLDSKRNKYKIKQGEIDKQLAELEEAQKNLKNLSITDKKSSKTVKPKFKKSKKRISKNSKQKSKTSEISDKIVGHNRNNYNLNLLIRSKTSTIRNIIKRGKQKDSELEGNITLKFTLLPNGKTKNVRIVKSNWTNKKVGKYVNRQIEKKVRKWVFPEDNNTNKSKIKPKKVVKVYHF